MIKTDNDKQLIIQNPQSLHNISILNILNPKTSISQSVGAIEYVECIFADGDPPPIHTPTSILDTARSHLIVKPPGTLGNVEYLFIAITPWSTLTCKVPRMVQIEIVNPFFLYVKPFDCVQTNN